MFEKELNSLFETMISRNYSQGIQWSIQKGNFSGRTALQFAKNYSLNGP